MTAPSAPSPYDAVWTEGRGTPEVLAATLAHYAGRVRQLVARNLPGEDVHMLVWTLVLTKEEAK